MNSTVAMTVSSTLSRPAAERPWASVNATASTVGACESTVTVCTVLKASLPASSTRRARKRYSPFLRLLWASVVFVQLAPPSLETWKAFSWMPTVSAPSRTSLKSLSPLMKSPAVPVSSNSARLSVPATGRVVSTLKALFTAGTARAASLPAASRIQPPLSTRSAAGIETPVSSVLPVCTT